MTLTVHDRPLVASGIDVRADELQVGDSITACGCIPLRVTAVSETVAGFVVASYECTAGNGQRLYAPSTILAVVRYSEEAH